VALDSPTSADVGGTRRADDDREHTLDRRRIRRVTLVRTPAQPRAERLSRERGCRIAQRVGIGGIERGRASVELDRSTT
jgi:hypothetical protein